VEDRWSHEPGILELHRDADPGLIEPTIASAGRPVRVQFHHGLPDTVLAATARALAQHPDIELRAYGFDVDPTLEWLAAFEHVENLSIDLLDATSFDAIANCTALRSLSLGETMSKRPSLDFLRKLPRLEHLFIEGHDKNFEAVGEVPRLRTLALRVCRAKSLDPLRGHPELEVLAMHFGGLRDLSPLPELPKLRGLELYQVRKLDSADLDPVGDCRALEAIKLGALRNVEHLRFLARRPRATLRLLTLDKLSGLATLADVAACACLEELGLYDSRPADGRLDFVLDCPSLDRLVISDAYAQEQLDAVEVRFRGETLRFGGETVRGSSEDVRVEWHNTVVDQLGL
jgi:hypothetical protein